MRRICADFIFLPDDRLPHGGSFKPLERGCVSLTPEGTVAAIEQLDSETFESAQKKTAQDNAAGMTYYKGIIVPGFVNAHCHIELSHLKGAFKEATGMSGFINQINALRESVDRQGRAAAMQAEFENFHRQGVVGVADISNCDESFSFKKTYQDAPLPVYYRTFVELFGSEPSDAQNVLNAGISLAAKGRAMGIEASVTPHSCYTMSPRLLEITAQEGLKSGYLSYHSQESKEEEDMIMYGTGALSENYKGRGLSVPPVTGTTALEYFIQRLRASDNGKPANTQSLIEGAINLVHNVVISQRAIDAAKAAFKNPFFTICPLSNIFIHRQLPPIELMRQNGLALCLGTDSLSSNKVLSMVEEIKCLQENFQSLPLGEILYWASLNGARAIGMHRQLGSIAPGKRPGLVHIDNIDYQDFKLTKESVSRRIA